MKKFKDVELTFDMHKLPKHDQEYLRTMFYETVMNRSIYASGLSFDEYYPDADNFTIFTSRKRMNEGMEEYNADISYTASHLLNGRKFWMAWTYYEPIED